MRGLLPPTPSGTPPGGVPSRRSACPIAWRGRATSRKVFPINHRSGEAIRRYPPNSSGSPSSGA
eukprot:794250-Prorocentrum_minimum.AAC.1